MGKQRHDRVAQEREDDRSKREVTPGEALVKGLKGLRDTLRSGERLEKRYTMRTVDLELDPQDYTSEDIKRIRDVLQVSQAVFAKLLGTSVRTVQSWEQGLTPPPMARRLLDLMSEDPERWRQILREATKGATKSSERSNEIEV